MASSEAAAGPARPGPAGALVRAYRAVRPPLRSPRFWFVQAAVLAIAALHDLVLVWLRQGEGPLAVPAPVTSVLLFVPVLYAALHFGVKGAVGTAVLSTLVIVPHWLTDYPLTTIHVWVETGNLVLLNAVAVVVGIRVERESGARGRAEEALQVAEVTGARYRALFGGNPAAVIIADADGVVVETNAAATRLFGDAAAGRGLSELLGQNAPSLIAGVPELELSTIDGETRLFAPSAQVISPQGTPSLLQVCLVDITDQHRRQEEQRTFGARLLAVQEDERRRLARDLHDDPLQTLMFLSRGLDDLADDPRLAADVADQLRSDAGLATDVGQALRKVIRGLRPPVLDDLGLVSALRQLVSEAAARADAPTIQLNVDGDPVRLAPQTELTAYRVVQESLSNVLRHADAVRVEVHATFGDELTLTVSDDGVGFRHLPATGPDHATSPHDQPEPRGGGLGLLGMRERVTAVGGDVEASERTPQGTTIRARLPVSPRLHTA